MGTNGANVVFGGNSCAAPGVVGGTSSTEVLKVQAIDVPQYIVVKTQFISKNSSKLLDPTVKFVTLNNEIMPMAPAPAPPPFTEPPAKKAKIQKPVVCTLVNPNRVAMGKGKGKDATTMTNSPHPKRDRGIQTDIVDQKTTASINIQCNLAEELAMEEEDYFGDAEISSEANSPTTTSEVNNNADDDDAANAVKMQKFQEFVGNNTYTYRNGQMECLICGEFAKTSPMNYHMAAHYGPRYLCPDCGILPMFRNHKCSAAIRMPSTVSPRFKCPHIDCHVWAISQLELYDHINEHVGKSTYRCYNGHCDRTFTTASEFMHHVKREKVKPAARLKNKYNLKSRRERLYRNRVFPIYSFNRRPIYVISFLSIRERANNRRRLCCQSCLKRFRCKITFFAHAKACRSAFYKRLRNKANAAKTKGTK